jgi:hypothetical protein
MVENMVADVGEIHVVREAGHEVAPRRRRHDLGEGNASTDENPAQYLDVEVETGNGCELGRLALSQQETDFLEEVVSNA